MLSDLRLREKYQSYLSMCEEEELDPCRVLSYDVYSEMYQEILHMDMPEER